eukprot:1162544_1
MCFCDRKQEIWNQMYDQSLCDQILLQTTMQRETVGLINGIMGCISCFVCSEFHSNPVFCDVFLGSQASDLEQKQEMKVFEVAMIVHLVWWKRYHPKISAGIET